MDWSCVGFNVLLDKLLVILEAGKASEAVLSESKTLSNKIKKLCSVVVRRSDARKEGRKDILTGFKRL